MRPYSRDSEELRVQILLTQGLAENKNALFQDVLLLSAVLEVRGENKACAEPRYVLKSG